MTALTLVRDGAATAVQLVALLFAVPAAAAPETSAASAPQTQVAPHAPPSPSPELRAARDLHLMSSALDVQLLGSLADIRIVQTVHNASAQSIDLGARLPATDEHVEQLRIERAGHSVDLLAGAVDGCGSDEADPYDGHVQAALDEALADVLWLPAGQQATIEVVAIDVLENQAGAYRLALPATALPVGAQALLVAQADVPVLIVVPPSDIRGVATLTLRPAGSAPEVIALGRADGAAFAVPLADATALARLVAGAVELEVVDGDRLLWTSLPPSIRHAGVAPIARTAR